MMWIRALPAWKTISCCYLISVAASAYGGQHHAPYVDRYSSTPHSTSLATSHYASQTVADGAICADGACGSGAGGQLGRRGEICPVPTRASLKLWVPENATVCINDQPTKLQSLGGVHAGSRIFNLAGLDNGPLTVCIVVECCTANGQVERGEHQFVAEAGAKYEFRYPAGFVKLASFESASTLELPHSDQPSLVVPNQVPDPFKDDDTFTPPPGSEKE